MKQRRRKRGGPWRLEEETGGAPVDLDGFLRRYAEAVVAEFRQSLAPDASKQYRSPVHQKSGDPENGEPNDDDVDP